MENYFNILFSEVNITLTVLLIVLIIYWLITMITGIDMDVNIDIDANFDLDAGIEGGNMDFHDVANAEVDRQHVVNKRTTKLKWWQILLIYFNFVGLPFMFTFTLWIFNWWLISVLITSLTNSYDNYIGFLIILASILPAFFLTKVTSTPFKLFFKNLNKDGDKAIDFIGRKAILVSSISGEKLGNAEVLADGNPMSINVKSIDGSELNYRENVIIIKKSEDKNFFFVSKS